MRYYDFSLNQLEDKATELLIEFDKERLKKAKPLDVYEVIEKCLGVPYDWKYLTPDQSVLGATAFSDGYFWAWPESTYREDMMPYKVGVEKGTILIDATLTESDNRGRENFTVMHEVFHQKLHKKCFHDEGKNYMHQTYSRTIEGNIRCVSYALKIIEYQANTCAAAFLMPADLTKQIYEEKYRSAGFTRYNYGFMWNLIKDMADDFNVSKQAMSYRLQNLGLIDENEENLLK
jgi:hypothetical protein